MVSIREARRRISSMCRPAPEPKWMSGAQLTYARAMIEDMAPRRSPARSYSSIARSKRSRASFMTGAIGVDEGLAELETGRELDSTIAFLTSSPADPTSQLGGLIPILREAEGGRATELNLHLEVCVAQCLGQRGDFSQSFQPVAGATKHVEG